MCRNLIQPLLDYELKPILVNINYSELGYYFSP